MAEGVTESTQMVDIPGAFPVKNAYVLKSAKESCVPVHKVCKEHKLTFVQHAQGAALVDVLRQRRGEMGIRQACQVDNNLIGSVCRQGKACARGAQTGTNHKRQTDRVVGTGNSDRGRQQGFRMQCIH